MQGPAPDHRPRRRHHELAQSVAQRHPRRQCHVDPSRQRNGRQDGSPEVARQGIERSSLFRQRTESAVSFPSWVTNQYVELLRGAS